MSGSHRPGETYKIKITSVEDTEVTFSGDVSGSIEVPEGDVSYFTVGSQYVLHIRPAAGYGSSSESPKT